MIKSDYVQTHWLWTPIDDIEVMVKDGRVYTDCVIKLDTIIDLGSVEELKERGNKLTVKTKEKQQ